MMNCSCCFDQLNNTELCLNVYIFYFYRLHQLRSCSNQTFLLVGTGTLKRGVTEKRPHTCSLNISQ